jgi:hypothetical protein
LACSVGVPFLCQGDSHGHFTPDIMRTVGLTSRTMATAAAMAKGALTANRVEIFMDPYSEAIQPPQ